jgi:hypothetical protein
MLEDEDYDEEAVIDFMGGEEIPKFNIIKEGTTKQSEARQNYIQEDDSSEKDWSETEDFSEPIMQPKID